MMTIKEMSRLTGVSARTLRYYDEIGLFSPTEKSAAGYRLYDEKALERLRYILYFREMGIPLGLIKQIVSDPALDRNNVLRMQKKMLEAEKERLVRLIDSIDAVLKGAEMDFTVFEREKSKRLFEVIWEHMPDIMKETALNEFSTFEEWREHYIDAANSVNVQNQFEKVVEWYGDKNAYSNASYDASAEEIRRSYQNRIERILEKLNKNRGLDTDSFDIRALIGEYGFVLKQVLQLKDEKEMMLSQAKVYRDDHVKEDMDKKYGDGFSDYLSRAIIAFYNR
ncbi:MAG: MerR family transcriptional regulator [Clostridia bacterium]|nr:MerR family transcriptional regulator [Clostridia bacterium]